MVCPRHAAFGLAIAWALAVACGSGTYACSSDSECDAGDAAGFCEDSGFCSFPDPSCESGRRYGGLSGAGLAGMCVDAGGSTGSTTSTSMFVDATSDDGNAASTGAVTVTATTDGSTTGVVDDCPSDWWDCAWSSRMRLSASPFPDDSDLSGVQVLVTLTPARVDLADALPDGSDLRFVDDGGVVAPHDIERFGDGSALVWVRWSTLAGPSPDLVMYWGNPEAPALDTTAATWGDEHESVWHLDTSLGDARGANPLTPTNVQSAVGRIGEGQLFAGLAARLTGQTSLASIIEAPVTFEAWILPTGWGTDGTGRILDNADDNTVQQGWSWLVTGYDEGMALRIGVGGQPEVWEAPGTILLGEWHYIALVMDPRGAQMFVDGQPVATSPGGNGRGIPMTENLNAVTLGGIPADPQSTFDGTLDEVRIAAVARSPAWIAAQYASMTDALLVYGSTEHLPSGDGETRSQGAEERVAD